MDGRESSSTNYGHDDSSSSLTDFNSSEKAEYGIGSTGSCHGECPYHPIPYPYTKLSDSGVPLIDTPNLTLPLVNTLLHLSQDTAIAPKNVPHVLNAYNASTASRVENGVWAYFHPVITELPTKGQIIGTVGASLPLSSDTDSDSDSSDDSEPGGLILPSAIARDLSQDGGRWVPLSQSPGRRTGPHARYRFLVFLHRSLPDTLRGHETRDAVAVYTMTIWDREAGALTHHDFSPRGVSTRFAAAQLFWSSMAPWFELPSPSPRLPTLAAQRPPYTTLSALQARLDRPLAPPTSLYAVLGASLHLVNTVCSPAPPAIPDDADTATALGPTLLPALYERVFLLLRAQPRVDLGTSPRGVVGAANKGSQYEGRMFHATAWLNKHLAVARRGSVFREGLRDRLMAHVPVDIDLGTVLLLTRRELKGLAAVSGTPDGRR
ncbi:hypothetical protein F4810DRAFT_722077 [Camillea tinctor]|nr:hypothetical protein F4810DRAFT_722077 [Camillea tinctor]